MMETSETGGGNEEGAGVENASTSQRKHDYLSMLLGDGQRLAVREDGSIWLGWKGDGVELNLEVAMGEKSLLDPGIYLLKKGEQLGVKLRVDSLTPTRHLPSSATHLLVTFADRDLTIDYCEKTCRDFDATHPHYSTSDEFASLLSYLNSLLLHARFSLRQNEIIGLRHVEVSNEHVTPVAGGAVDPTDPDELAKSREMESDKLASRLIVKDMRKVYAQYAKKRPVVPGYARLNVDNLLAAKDLPIPTEHQSILPLISALILRHPGKRLMGEHLVYASNIPVFDPLVSGALRERLNRSSIPQAHLLHSPVMKTVWTMVIVGEECEELDRLMLGAKWIELFPLITSALHQLATIFAAFPFTSHTVVVKDRYRLKMESRPSVGRWDRIGMTCEVPGGKANEGPVMVVEWGRVG